MRRLFVGLFSGLFLMLSLSACNVTTQNQVAEFWRPISAPNTLMTAEKAQTKLDFDLSQCHCGIFPANVSQPDLIAFQPDKQRLAETSVNFEGDEDKPGTCSQSPSMVVTECMRARGWEVTNCSGRMAIPGAGTLCSAYVVKD